MAVAFDAASQIFSGAATSLTRAHTAAGSNRYLAVFAGVWNHNVSGAEITAVTYNGLPLTLISASAVNSSQLAAEWWGFVVPAGTTGPQDVVVTIAPAGYTYVAVLSFTGVHQTTPISGAATDFENVDGTTPVTLTVPSASGEMVVAGYVAFNVGTLQAPGTERTSQDGGNETGTAPGAASVLMDWNVAWRHVISGLSLAPSTAGGPIALAGTSILTLTATGALTTAIRLAGTSTLSLGALGALTTGIRLAGTSALTLSTSAALTTAIRLAGTSTLSLGALGALTTGIRLAGTSTLTLTATGALATPAAALAGTSTLTLATTGALTTGIDLAGVSSLTLTTAADLQTQIRLAGTSLLTLSASGAFLVPIRSYLDVAFAVSAVAPSFIASEVTPTFTRRELMELEFTASE